MSSKKEVCVLHDHSENEFKKWVLQMKQYNIIRTGTNQPELRQKSILEELQKKFELIEVRPNILTTNDLILNEIHSDKYIKFLESSHSSFCDNEDDQFTDILLGNCLIPINISYYKNFSPKNFPIYKQISHFAYDNMTPIYSNTFGMAMSSANICFQAKKYLEDYKIVYCSTVFPGHHAKFSGYAGYCFINNALVVALSNKSKEKITILDLDYHYGDGADTIIKSKNILHISIHADTNEEYPFEQNDSVENSESIIFSKNTTWELYETLLNKAICKIFEFDPSFIVIAFGADTLINDPDTNINYGCNLEIKDYYKMGYIISKKLKKNVIVTNEGGYSPFVSKCVNNFLSGLQEGLRL